MKIMRKRRNYNAVIELRNKKQAEKQTKQAPKPKEQPQKKESNLNLKLNLKKRKKKNNHLQEELSKIAPPPEKFERRARPPPTRTKREPADDELYSQANIEMLRQRFYQQTRARLQSDLFGY